MSTSDPTVRKITRPRMALPKSCPYEPFLPTPEKFRDENHNSGEYVPVPVNPNPVEYHYTPTPVDNKKQPNEPEKPKTITVPEKPKTFAPKKNRVCKGTKRDTSLPTELIGKDSLYWLPVLEKTRKPKRPVTYFFMTLCDGQRVKVFTHKTGQIDVYRKGTKITIREPEP